jgi:type II secretory pathway component PulM
MAREQFIVLVFGAMLLSCGFYVISQPLSSPESLQPKQQIEQQ